MCPDASGVRVAVLTADDPVFALTAWEVALPALAGSGFDVAGLWVVPDRMGRYSGSDIGRWYVRAFGWWSCLALGFFRVFARFFRGLFLRPLSLSSLCRRCGVEYFMADSANDPRLAVWLEDKKIDHLLIMTGEILRAPVLRAVRGHVINCHGGLLPQNRGLFPQVWAVVRGWPQGVSFHVVTGRIDGGPVFFRRVLPQNAVPRTVTGFALMQAAAYSEGVLQALEGRVQEPLPEAEGYSSLPDPETLRLFRAKGGGLVSFGDFLTFICLILKRKNNY